MPHFIHDDPDWEVRGAHAYHQCRRCGARLTVDYHRGVATPIEPGWPPLVDRHGTPRQESGWVKPPKAGWPETGASLADAADEMQRHWHAALNEAWRRRHRG